jgi:hypothetical protein
MEWKWMIGAILLGFGLPAFVYGAVGWDSANPKISDIYELLAGLISTTVGSILVWNNEKKNK